ncbi:LysR family transcriptional regulator [Leucobacter sp. G161]|uniref:LysR family transcriptional regulator n=1 Tax=Leucobacter sp. G161 TaxID=663704 RepID=UPI00073B87DE|nr:LysR family transcriptional regulator [Leucobacter sp. G161]KUF07680.1 hypothetical protein AUL38_07475 [Leucobacter sp. G161]
MSDFRRLQTFLDFARLGTIAAVAQTSQYSTSAVSQQLERLADELGTPLLEPHGRLLRLTAAGELLVQRGPQLLENWEEIRSALAATRDEVRGTVSVASFQTGCLAYFPKLLAQLGEQTPHLRVQCLQAEPEHSLPALRSREIDVAVVERYPGQTTGPHPELQETALGRDPMLLGVPMGWGYSGDPRWLADRPWVFEAKGSPARAWAESFCHLLGFEPLVAHETSDVVVQCSFVASGAAAAFIPALTPELLRGSGTYVALPPEQSRSLLAVVRRSAEQDVGVRAVITALSRLTG